MDNVVLHEPFSTEIRSGIIADEKRTFDRLSAKPRGLIYFKNLEGDCQFGSPGRVLVPTDTSNPQASSPTATGENLKFLATLEPNRYIKLEFVWTNIYFSSLTTGPALDAGRHSCKIFMFIDGKQVQQARTTNVESPAGPNTNNHDGSGRMFYVFKTGETEHKYTISISADGGGKNAVFLAKADSYVALYDLGTVNNLEIV